jgi:N-methylhydantoinase A
MWRIGIDIGGTFTDVAIVDEATGKLGIAKTATTPQDFGQGVLNGLRDAIAEYGVAPNEVGLLSHATTIVTNALLEEKGVKAALITTRGFRDVLELRRSARADLYDLFQDSPAVLVPRSSRFEVTERISAQGEVVTPLALDEVDALIERIRAEKYEAVAVTLLFSFLNSDHERALGERIRAALPDVPVFLSCEVLPEVQEFERTSTTAVCAYVGPLLKSYLARLEAATRQLGLPRLHVMASAGGVVDVKEALRMPAAIVESGPAAGVIAAIVAGKQIGETTLLSFDMGGTTAKACLIKDSEVETTSDYEVGGQGNQNRWLHGTGHPVRVPVIDLAEVSAGGGSIAWVDPAGALRVGPASAGAEPGPVCYGRGGTRPTVTDANLVLGYLDQSSLLGGRMSIDSGAATKAFDTHIGKTLGLGATEAAAAVIDIVNNAMAEALRIVSVERGHDPRDFGLMAFGGAGPLHAAALADELDIPEVIVPPIPGGFSALGLVGADIRRDYSRTLYAALDRIDHDQLETVWAEMERDAEDMLAQAGIAPADRQYNRSAGLRYARQAYELNVSTADAKVTAATIAGLTRDFHSKHQQTYGHHNPSEPVQLVTLRLTAIGKLPDLEFSQRSTEGGASLKGRRKAWFRATGFVDCDIHERGRIAHDDVVMGPAVIESFDSTIVVPPNWKARATKEGFVRMERKS